MLRSPLLLAAGCALDVDARTIVEAAAAAGFDGVGLRLSHDHMLGASGTSGITDIAGLLRERGLQLHDAEVHRITGETRSTATDPGPLIDAAAELGAARVLVVSDLADDARTLDELGRFAERCRAAGITAALEYMAWTNPRSSAGAVAMAEAVGNGACVVVDLLHHHRLGEGVDELRAVVASGRLGWVQLCDAPGAGPEGASPDDVAALIVEARHGRLPPGEGGLPLAELLRVVPEGTPISVEVQSDVLAQRPAAERAALLHRAATAVLLAHDPNSTG